ncbi:MAG: tetratricopeptide repeat protein [Chitinophagales bacterium]
MRLAVLVCLWVIGLSAAAQDTVSAYKAKVFYDKGMVLAREGNLGGAVQLLHTSISFKPDEPVVWFNLGIAELMQKHYLKAIGALDTAIALYPPYKQAWLNRGTARKALTDYRGAIDDYTKAIMLDSVYPEAFYNRGLVYEKLLLRDTACLNFARALQLQMNEAKKKVDRCKDTADAHHEVHAILYLNKQSTDAKYGFTEKNPVKVGLGPVSGPGNENDYFELLRDAQGEPVKYERLGSCCEYKSPNGFMGYAMLDRYQLTYHDAEGKEQKTVVYISFYDYEEPQVLAGFKTVTQP